MYSTRTREAGVKYDLNKVPMSLLPLKDLEGVARVLQFGAKKYKRGDWVHVPYGGTRYLDAGIRHLGEVVGTGGLDSLQSLDPESGLPHIDHAICSLIFARHFIFKGDITVKEDASREEDVGHGGDVEHRGGYHD